MFNRSGSNTNSNYSKVHLDDFSDDSDNAGRDDFVESSLRNQQVRTNEQGKECGMNSVANINVSVGLTV